MTRSSAAESATVAASGLTTGERRRGGGGKTRMMLHCCKLKQLGGRSMDKQAGIRITILIGIWLCVLEFLRCLRNDMDL